MKTVFTLAMLGVAATTTAVHAGPNDYNYGEFKWIANGEADGPGGSTDYDGFGAEGMMAVGENMLIGGGVDILEADRGNLDPERYHAGFGLRHLQPMQGGYDLSMYGLVAYERLELGSDDGNGLGIRTGLRFNLTPMLEINPHLSYADYGDVLGSDVDGWTYGVRGVYQVNHVFAVTLGIQESSLDVETSDLDLEEEIALGARVYFE